MAYFGDGVLFCGDTLFSCGCGKLFEGTAMQMLSSLSKLAANPFLRAGNPAVAAAASQHAGRAMTNPVEVFATLRKWKDGF